LFGVSGNVAASTDSGARSMAIHLSGKPAADMTTIRRREAETIRLSA
jgi:hypothetical protein